MRKILYVSGVLTIMLLTLLLSGWAVADDKIKEAVSRGNQQYEAADYNKALEEYEAGLAVATDSKELNYNAAQMAYLLGDYEKAAEYYEKSEDTKEKFLNYGNIYFRSGDAVEDAEQKVQLYSQAMQIYETGIIKYPQEVPLKYNYELVKDKLAQLMQESEQNGESEESEDQQSEDGEQQEGDQEQQNSESESQDSESQEQEGDSRQQESEAEQETDDSQEQDTESQQQESGGAEQQDGESQQQEGTDQSDEEAVTDEEAIQRILQMLESQEEQSLKNNQEIVGGKEGKNGW